MGNTLSTLKKYDEVIRVQLVERSANWDCKAANSSYLLPEKMAKIKIASQPSLMEKATVYDLELEECGDASCDVSNSSPGRLPEIVKSAVKRDTVDSLQLYEGEDWHDALCDVSSLDRLKEIVNEEFKTEMEAVDNQRLGEEEEWHDTLCNVSDSLSDTHVDNVNEQSMLERKAAEHLQIREEEEMSDALCHISNSPQGKRSEIVKGQSVMEKQTAGPLKLKDKDEESDDRSPNVSPDKSCDILPSGPNTEFKAADHVQVTDKDEESRDKSPNAPNVSSDKPGNIPSPGLMRKRKVAEELQLQDRYEKSHDRSPNVPKVSSGKPDKIIPAGPTLKRKAAEKLQLEDKDEESHDISPEVPKISSGQSGNFSTAESKQITPLTHDVAPSTYDLKKEPLSVKKDFKPNPNAEVFIPRLKNVASSSTKAAIKDSTKEIAEIKSLSDKGATNSNDQLQPTEKSVVLPDVVTSNTISAFDQVTIDTSFDFMHDELFDYCPSDLPCGNDVPNPSDAADASQEMSNTHSETASTIVGSDNQLPSNNLNPPNRKFCPTPGCSHHVDGRCNEAPQMAQSDIGATVPDTDPSVVADPSQEMTDTVSTTASTIVGSDNQLPSNNLNPPNRKFCPTPGCRHHVDGRCNRTPETAQSDTGATVPDTQQEYLEYYAFPDSPVVDSTTQQTNPDHDVTDLVRTERPAPNWNVNDSNLRINLQKAEMWNHMHIEELYRTLVAEAGEAVDVKLQMAEVKKWVILSKIDLMMMEANHKVNLLYNMPCTMTKGQRDILDESFDLYMVNCTIMKHNVEILVQTVQEKLKWGQNVDWSTINVQAPSFQCFQPKCHLMSYFDQTFSEHF